MKQFIRKHDSDLQGVLSGFDRIRFRGTLRWLATERGMMSFLCKSGILLKDFVSYAKGLTKEMKDRIEALAAKNGRPFRYLESTRIRKEDAAREIVSEDNITEGLIGVLRCVEPCYTYEVAGDAAKKQLKLRRFWSKCTHLYLYFIDPVFGFGHLRLQSWFPFTIHVTINGREWLCRELERRGIGYVRRDNCLVAVDDVAQAQQILDGQVTAAWQSLLNRLAVWAFPLHQSLYRGEPMHYYWSADDTEWASDLMFRSPKRLKQLYPQLLHHAMTTFSSPDVLRFLGRKVPAHGAVNGNFAGEVLSELQRRPEGVRIKHRLNFNSIKMYDKQGSVLRVETTITHPRDIKVYRRKEGDPEGPLGWQRLRKGVCDLPRRTQVSQASNNRYLDALAAAEDQTPLRDVAQDICQRTTWQGRSVRGLHPLQAEDQALLQAVMRGEFAINGFRNGDLRTALFGEPADDVEKRRQAGAITRRLRILRAHRLIKKIPTTHRYVLTSRGRTKISALLAALKANTRQLNKLAA